MKQLENLIAVEEVEEEVELQITLPKPHGNLYSIYAY